MEILRWLILLLSTSVLYYNLEFRIDWEILNIHQTLLIYFLWILDLQNIFY
jgi:hypothetical protein